MVFVWNEATRAHLVALAHNSAFEAPVRAALAEIDRLSKPTWHDQTLSDLAMENRRLEAEVERLTKLVKGLTA